jgi:hypothetical protein
MILRELFYFDKETVETVDDDRYEPEYDETPVDYDDTRKTRLTLLQINRTRKSSELHNKDKAKELDFIKQMYGISANADAGGV